MTKILYTLLILMFMAAKGYGQTLVIIDSATTPSVCFNYGSIHVDASGGNGPYIFTIISGPSYPNITYPISLPPLSSRFLTLPHGQYTIKVVDAQGHIAFATATIGGSYTFPVASTTVDIDNCIHVAVSGGRPPFRYAISSQGTSVGFSAYQSSPVFCECSGHYWLRAIDSCSNIFTTSQVIINVLPPVITNIDLSSSATRDTLRTVYRGSASPYTFHLKSGSQSVTNSTGVFIIPKSCSPDTIMMIDRCHDTVVQIIDPHALRVSVISSCSTGNALMTIDTNALGPFSITGTNGSLSTRNHHVTFSSLPRGITYTFTIRDSCGHVLNLNLPCDSNQVDTNFFYDVCPFDHSLHFQPYGITLCFPAVLTCLSCTPNQIDTINAIPARLFTGIDTGVLYRVRIQDACGFDYIAKYIPHYSQLNLSSNIISCRDFSVSSNPAIFLPKVHYSLFNPQSFVDSVTIDTAYFYHLATGVYRVTGDQPFCYQGQVSVTLPALGGRCIVPMLDSSCTAGYAVFQTYVSTPEIFSLINTGTNAIYRQHLPPSSSGALLFANVPVGTYNLVSDSGCSVPYVLPAYHFDVTATVFSECTGQSKITAAVNPPIAGCNTSQLAYYRLFKDNLYQQGNLTGIFTVTDTGNYVVKLYFSNSSIFNFPAPYDTICPLDTFLIHVIVDPLPNLTSVQQEVCGHTTANIPYAIVGGSAPFTVQIIGYPTRTINGYRDTFPGVFPGIYTMIVSDNCGISKSFSVAVVDTCSSNCITQCHFSLADSIICRNARVRTNNQSFAATHYMWQINGTPYAYITDTTLTASAPGRYLVTLYAYIGTCKDSAKRYFVVEDTLRSSGITDTFLCLPFTLKLNTHNAHSIWSNNVHDSVVSISTPGSYWAQVSNSCGTTRDSITIGSKQSPVFDLSSPRNYICADQPDSAILTATLRDSTGAPVSFVWSTGFIDSLVYRSHIVVYSDSDYRVLVADRFCPLAKDIKVQLSSCDSACFHNVAIPNVFTPNGDNENDSFYVLHICDFDPFVMNIYNQWGERVFTSTDIKQGWDGRYKGEPQPTGVYWMWMSLSLEGKTTNYRSGTITLVR